MKGGGGGVPMESPGLWVIDKNWRGRIKNEQELGDETSEFTVGVMGSGQVFGELAVLDPDIPSPISIVSFTAVELYCIESDILIALGSRFNVDTMNSLNESINLHNPPGAKCEYYFRQKVMWEKEKSRIIGSFDSKTKNKDKEKLPNIKT
jgi:hypothetical protein